MCLDLNIFSFRRKAKTDIPVFKILVRSIGYYDGKVNTCTPFQKTKMELGKTYTSPLEREWFEVHHGLHSYAHFYDAEAMAKHLRRTRYYRGYRTGEIELLIVDAYIPKGSRYYVGDHQGNGKSYASESLQVTTEYVPIY